MVKFLASLSLITLACPVSAWISPHSRIIKPNEFCLQSQISEDFEESFEDVHELLSHELKPCWEEVASIDEDCVLGSIYASNFVAGDWIKSMPCAEGIEVSEVNYDID
mmetsp:Transcript_40343/g.94797  ORF Transcript_40343/g.94797 Transcript_40343/m.94797 type:complete len:108 (-) Transcript_40343:408-731(-)